MEATGLAIGAISLTALFTTCINTFNIVITVREFGRDYEIICADLALQRLRFCLWGETLGLVSRDAAAPLVQHAGLNDDQVRSTLTQALQAIIFLLQETERFRDRFSLRQRSSLGLNIFSQTYEQFRHEAAGRRRKAPVKSAIKWAVYGADKFKGRVESLKGLIDGLEQISERLGVLDVQRARLRTEVESVEDVESLRLLRDATTDENGNAFEVASSRLSVIERVSIFDGSIESDNATYFTAPELAAVGEADVNENAIDTEEPDSPALPTELAQNSRVIANLSLRPKYAFKPMDNTKLAVYGSRLGAYNVVDMASSGTFPEHLSYVREAIQRQSNSVLWDEAVLAGPRPLGAPDFSTQEAFRSYKPAVSPKKSIVKYLRDALPTARLQPLVCWPVDNNLFHLLGGIEGPPDTPYEGGVFWLSIRISKDFPLKPPEVRLLTRIYHPNIDRLGNICVDLLSHQWFCGTGFEKLLLSILSILDDPGLEDPLVPEIAETYLRDPDLYRENACKYTIQYAMASDLTNGGT